MEQKGKNLKTMVIVGAAVLIVIVILIMVFTSSLRSGQRQTISLPETGEQAQTSEPGDETASSTDFAQVDRDNVLDIISMLSRPSAYHQTLTVSTMAAASSRTDAVEIWVGDGLLRATLSSQFETKNLLTDGKSLYLWYEGEATAQELQLDAFVTLDDLLGIPTYEEVLALPTAAITEADFVTLQEMNDQACVFVKCEQGGESQYYWISLDSGLLCRQTTLEDNEQVYALEQTALELLAEGDETLQNVFTLPDGATPFAKSE